MYLALIYQVIGVQFSGKTFRILFVQKYMHADNHTGFYLFVFIETRSKTFGISVIDIRNSSNEKSLYFAPS